jgi:transcriptional regulator with XRE-family HTH domain
MVAKKPAPASDGEARGKQGFFKTLKPSANTNTIRKWRTFRGIESQGELAEKAGLTRATLSRLESGVLRYRQDQLEALAGVLECTPHDLIGVDLSEEADIFRIYRGLDPKLQTVLLDTLKKFDE